MSAKWISFQEVQTQKKTKTFTITANEGGQVLGEVKWYAPWRKYSFFPSQNTLFETQCLKDIVEFIENLHNERRVEKENRAALIREYLLNGKMS